MAQRQLTIFLLKPDQGDDPLRQNTFPSYEVKREETHIGNLYIKPSHDRPAGWLAFFEGTIGELLERVVNANTAAALLIKRAGRVFAVCFGYGRSMLKPGCWEEDFGLKVTLNSVDPDKIKSVDRMSLDAIGQHSQIQASQESNIRDFGLDLEQDLLRAVTGTPADNELGKRLTGKDELKVTTDIGIGALPAFLDKVFQQWQSKAYAESFPWIDQIKELKDRELIEKLEAVLVNQIKSGDFTRLWLTIPQLIDWSRIEGFKYWTAETATVYSDVYFPTYLEELGGPEKITIERLKSRRIYAVTQEGQHTEEEWPVYRCIYFETDHDGNTYLLTNGKWYRVGTTFLERINSAYAAMPKNSVALPGFDDQKEEDYNIRVSGAEPDKYAVMDQHFIKYPDNRGKVEFCDLYTKGKHLIHIKRYAGSSAPLSHLFAQAVVSSSLFRRESEFRKKVNDELPGAYRPVTEQPKQDEYEVIFGVVSESEKDLILPLFSRINLKNAADRLGDLGFKVSITKIQAKKKAEKKKKVKKENTGTSSTGAV